VKLTLALIILAVVLGVAVFAWVASVIWKQD